VKTAFLFMKAAFFYTIQSQEKEGNKWEEITKSKTRGRKAFKEREIVLGSGGTLAD